jgi:D-alanyl-D-alanine carboxypeptidase (penicillin-binding protein 5/6)
MKLLSPLLLSMLLFAGAAPAATPAPAPAPTPAPATPVPKPPSVNATSWLVMDFNSRQLLAEHNIDERVEPASLTKMMTVYVVASEIKAGHIRLEDMVRVSEKAWRMGGSKMFIEVDKEVSVADLLHGVIVQSGNDASVALAEHVSGSEEVFAAMMNQHARRLGMNHTHFTNSTGWPDPEHYTTARDMATLAAALIRDYPDIYAWHSIKEFTFNGIKQHNRNDLLYRDSSVDGVKTGHTETAGYCLVASAKRDDMRLISVVMGTPGPKARAQASEALLNYAFRFYETHKLATAGEQVATARIWKGVVDAVSMGITGDLWVTVPRGAMNRVETRAEVKTPLSAPVDAGSVLGNLKVSLDGKELASRPLVALGDVAAGSFFKRVMDSIFLALE